MSKFPNAVALPDEVYTRRTSRNKQVMWAAKLGIAFRLAVILIELLGILLINSSALFLDMISSLMDVLSTVFLIFCLKLACRPPDSNHPFGHGRYEPIGGLLLGIFLSLLGAVMFVQQLSNLFHGMQSSHIHSYSWLFPAVSMVLLEAAYRLMRRTAQQAQSPALAADAAHYRLDSLTSSLAAIALWAAVIWPEWAAVIDQGGAIAIALFMAGMGWHASRDNFHQLMDRTPDDKFFACVKRAALQAAGVEATEKIRIQQYGPDAHVDIDIEVQPDLSVEKAHEISQQVRVEIQKAWPAVQDVTVHIEPYYADDH